MIDSPLGGRMSYPYSITRPWILDEDPGFRRGRCGCRSKPFPMSMIWPSYPDRWIAQRINGKKFKDKATAAGRKILERICLLASYKNEAL
jgi:hypothetical protein